MRVSANVYDGTILQPTYNEFKPFAERYGAITYPTKTGFRFNSERDYETLFIKGKPYPLGLNEPFVPRETKAFHNGQDALRYSRRVVSVNNGDIVDCKKCVVTRENRNIEQTDEGYSIVGVPQPFGVYKLSGVNVVLIGATGSYNFKTNLFFGVAYFAGYTEFEVIRSLNDL